TRMYLKEEEFLEEFLGTVEAALPFFPIEWRPNYSCNDDVRDDAARRRRAGTLHTLTFEDAVLFNDQNGLSSAGIYLRSSERYVVLKIRFGGGKVTVEKRGDTPMARRLRGRVVESGGRIAEERSVFVGRV